MKPQVSCERSQALQGCCPLSAPLPGVSANSHLICEGHVSIEYFDQAPMKGKANRTGNAAGNSPFCAYNYHMLAALCAWEPGSWCHWREVPAERAAAGLNSARSEDGRCRQAPSWVVRSCAELAGTRRGTSRDVERDWMNGSWKW